MAAPFDLKQLQLIGPAVPMLEGVMEDLGDGSAQFSVSDQGTLFYIQGSPRAEEGTLVWVDREGKELPLSAPPRPYLFPRLSPDGRLIAVDIQSDIWVYDLARETLSRLTFGGTNSFPMWSPDGNWVVYHSAKPGKLPNLAMKPADGSGMEERLTSSENTQYPFSWSPHGQMIAFTENNPTTGLDIWVLPISEGRKPRLFLQTPFTETGAKFSPDGRWLAYASNESGQYEIYVQPYPGPGGKWQVSNEGGVEPVWGSNGELFFRNSNRMMAVETRTQPTFSAGTPRVIFQNSYDPRGPGVQNYAVTADGKRFVMVKLTRMEGGSPRQINVVLNWFEELKQKVPVE